MARQPSVFHVIIISILFVALGIALLMYFDVNEDVLRLLDWLDALGIWGPLLFIMVMVLVVVLLLPGVMFTAGAGFVFGVVEGTFSGRFPMARIDHVFVDPAIEVLGIEAPDTELARVASDHLPLIAELRFPASAESAGNV